MFNHPPTLELLQWLTRGSLKQNLARAVRLWVWLRLLYGQEGERLELPEPFTYAMWRDVFFMVEVSRATILAGAAVS